MSNVFDSAFEAGARAGWARLVAVVVSKLVPLVVPWILTFGLLPLAAWGTHTRWGGPPPSPWAAVALTLSAVVLTGLTWLTARRGPIGRAHSTLTTLGAMTWLTTATITGPGADLTMDLLIWGGGSNALAWSLRRMVHGDDDAPGAVTPGLWARISERVGLGGSKLTVTDERPNVVRGTLQLEGGKQTPKDVANRRGEIAGALAVPPNGVRVAEDPDRAQRSRVCITTKAVVRVLIHWRGAAAPGQSITDAPITYGLHEDAESALMWLVRPDGTSTHLLICGMTNAGKSETARVCVADGITRYDLVIWAIDTRKKLQTFGAGDLHTCFDWFATTTRDASQMLRVLNHNIIPGRAEAMGRYGYDKWTPQVYADERLKMPYLLVWMEEAAAIASKGDNTIDDIVESARSAGIGLVFSLQRASWDRMSTSTRANLGSAICFGVKTRDDAEFALGDDLVAQGADPSPWENKRPGRAFSTLGNDASRYLIPLRGALGAKEQFAQAVAVRRQILAAGHGRLDDLTARLAGKPYANRTRPEALTGAAAETVDVVDDDSEPVVPLDADTDTAGALEHGQAVQAAARTRPLAHHDDDQDPDEDEGLDEQSVADAITEAREDAMHDPELVDAAQGISRLEAEANAAQAEGFSADINTPIEPSSPPEGTWQLGDPDAAQLSPEAARETVISRINEWEDEGRTTFAPRDLADLVVQVGRSRTWIYNVLSDLETSERITRSGVGAYRINPRTLTAVATRG